MLQNISCQSFFRNQAFISCQWIHQNIEQTRRKGTETYKPQLLTLLAKWMCKQNARWIKKDSNCPWENMTLLISCHKLTPFIHIVNSRHPKITLKTHELILSHYSVNHIDTTATRRSYVLLAYTGSCVSYELTLPRHPIRVFLTADQYNGACRTSLGLLMFSCDMNYKQLVDINWQCVCLHTHRDTDREGEKGTEKEGERQNQ